MNWEFFFDLDGQFALILAYIYTYKVLSDVMVSRWQKGGITYQVVYYSNLNEAY